VTKSRAEVVAKTGAAVDVCNSSFPVDDKSRAQYNVVSVLKNGGGTNRMRLQVISGERCVARAAVLGAGTEVPGAVARVPEAGVTVPGVGEVFLRAEFCHFVEEATDSMQKLGSVGGSGKAPEYQHRSRSVQFNLGLDG
jgi:hypothetical protein